MLYKLESFHHNLAEKKARTREKILGPRKIVFKNGMTLQVELSGEKPRISLFDKDNKQVLNLRDLAPEGTELEFNNKKKWGAEPGKVYIGEFKDVDCLLSYLHELGHLWNDHDFDIVNSSNIARARERVEDERRAFPDSRLSAIKEGHEVNIASERSAWAMALRQARKLEQVYGIDILSRIGNTEDVMKFINKYLKTYEDGTLGELNDMDIFTKEDMLKLFADLDKKQEEN